MKELLTEALDWLNDQKRTLDKLDLDKEFIDDYKAFCKKLSSEIGQQTVGQAFVKTEPLDYDNDSPFSKHNNKNESTDENNEPQRGKETKIKKEFYSDKEQESNLHIKLPKRKGRGRPPKIGRLKQMPRCEVCDKPLRNMTHYARHMLIHDSNRRHECELCNKTFKTIPILQSHKKTHLGIKRYECKICNKFFTRSYDRNRHQIHRHGKESISKISEEGGRYQCKVCHKMFKKQLSLETHMLTHSETKQLKTIALKCNICHENFSLRRDLETHFKAHASTSGTSRTPKTTPPLSYNEQNYYQPNEFFCDMCRVKFQHEKDLKRHIKIEHASLSKEKVSHKCCACDEIFNNDEELEDHYSTHGNNFMNSCILS